MQRVSEGRWGIGGMYGHRDQSGRPLNLHANRHIDIGGVRDSDRDRHAFRDRNSDTGTGRHGDNRAFADRDGDTGCHTNGNRDANANRYTAPARTSPAQNRELGFRREWRYPASLDVVVGSCGSKSHAGRVRNHREPPMHCGSREIAEEMPSPPHGPVAA